MNSNCCISPLYLITFNPAGSGEIVTIKTKNGKTVINRLRVAWAPMIAVLVYGQDSVAPVPWRIYWSTTPCLVTRHDSNLSYLSCLSVDLYVSLCLSMCLYVSLCAVAVAVVVTFLVNVNVPLSSSPLPTELSILISKWNIASKAVNEPKERSNIIQVRTGMGFYGRTIVYRTSVTHKNLIINNIWFYLPWPPIIARYASWIGMIRGLLMYLYVCTLVSSHGKPTVCESKMVQKTMRFEVHAPQNHNSLIHCHSLSYIDVHCCHTKHIVVKRATRVKTQRRHTRFYFEALVNTLVYS